MRQLWLIVCVGIMTEILLAQPEPRFDVVSIRPNRSGAVGGRNALEQDGYAATNITLRRMIALAWQPVPDAHIVGGPDWMSSDRFDVQARFSGPPSRPQLQSMLRAMLADRFALRVHTESRPTRVYALTMVRDGVLGAALTRSTSDCGSRPEPNAGGQSGPTCGFRHTDGVIQGHGVTIDQLARELTADRPTINRTGVTGRYDVELRWTPDTTAAPPDDAPPGLGTALREQLGLKLDAATVPMDHLVVDGAERPEPN
jgi:uncharacterized protein (TIGR03435 family)